MATIDRDVKKVWVGLIIYMLSAIAGALIGYRYGNSEPDVTPSVTSLFEFFLEYYSYLKYNLIIFFIGFTIYSPVTCIIILICCGLKLGNIIRLEYTTAAFFEILTLLVSICVSVISTGQYIALKNAVPDFAEIISEVKTRTYMVNFLILSGFLLLILLLKNLTLLLI